MSVKFNTTEYRPEKPLLVWDGQCGFCRYWVTRWKKLTGDAVRYMPYQEIHTEIHDIPEEAFKEAVRMIAADGRIFSGAEAAYRTLWYSDTWKWLYGYYQKSSIFRTVSERTYRFVADHCPSMHKVTKVFFGKDPNTMKPYWILYLAGILLLLFVFNYD